MTLARAHFPWRPRSTAIAAIVVGLGLLGCYSANPGVARDVPPYRAAASLTPFGLGEVETSGAGNGADRTALRLGLERVLRSSNFFDPGAPAGRARVTAKILRYSTPPAGMAFTTTLEVTYTVLAPDGTTLLAQQITTQGADDSGGTMAAQRASRAKTLAMANNLYDFRTDLEPALLAHSKREHPSYLASASAGAPANAGGRPGYVAPSMALAGEAIVPLDLSELGDRSAFDSGRYYALVIGNDRYETLQNLETASNDARAVAEILERAYDFEVTTLIDARRGDILRQMAEFRRALEPEDSLLIYYAGHGWFDEGTRRGYWLPIDASETDPANWVSAADLTDILRAMSARHVMVVADSCYSGSLTRGLQIQNRDDAYIQRLARKRARVVLTSGGLEPVTDSGGGGHSVFARAFLDALEANPGVLEGAGIFNQLRKPVVLRADQTPEYGDIRFAGHEGGDFLFIRK